MDRQTANHDGYISPDSDAKNGWRAHETKYVRYLYVGGLFLTEDTQKSQLVQTLRQHLQLETLSLFISTFRDQYQIRKE